MSLMKYDRFGDPGEMANEIRKGILQGLFQTGDETWRPVFDVSETPDEFRIKVAVPGITKDEISVEIRDDTVIISGERRETKLSDEEECHIKEISYGKFTRSLRLPIPIDADDVTAKFKDGIIFITLPKSERIKPRKVKIED